MLRRKQNVARKTVCFHFHSKASTGFFSRETKHVILGTEKLAAIIKPMGGHQKVAQFVRNCESSALERTALIKKNDTCALVVICY
jgi:hypothetical protein